MGHLFGCGVLWAPSTYPWYLKLNAKPSIQFADNKIIGTLADAPIGHKGAVPGRGRHDLLYVFSEIVALRPSQALA